MSNVLELDEEGQPKVGWCFVPTRPLAAGDVMLAQKIALETEEMSVLTRIFGCQNCLFKFPTMLF